MEILMDTVPAVSWLGIAMTIAIGLIGFSFRDLLNQMRKRIDDIEENVDSLAKKANAYETATNEKINTVYINILGKIDEMKDKFSSMRNS